MINFIINQCIKINLNLLNLKRDVKKDENIKNFIMTLNSTRLIVFIGSVCFFLFYTIFLTLFSRKTKYEILLVIPQINKIFQFYRKIILLTYYD